MTTVWKYTIDIGEPDTWHQATPSTARVVHVHPHQGSDRLLDLWVEVDRSADAQPDSLDVFVVGTGHDFADVECAHVGSVVTPNLFAWHVYQRVS